MSKRLLLAGTIYIAALVAGCLFVILPVYGQPGDIPTRQEEVPVPSLDVLVLVDESETMWNYTDPEDKRVRAVNLFIDELSTLAHRGDKHRVGIIAFGTEPKVIPWTFLDSKEDADGIKQKYRAVHDAIGNSEYTDIDKALKKALEIMEEHDSSRKPALILISDGQPTRPFPPVNEEQGWDVVNDYLRETQQTIDEFKAVSYTGSLCPAEMGTPLFVLAVGTDVLTETSESTLEFVNLYKNFWKIRADSTGGYYETVASLDEVGSAVTEVFGRLACGVVYKEKVEDVRELQFIVAEEYFQTFFIISGKDNPAIKVFRPGRNKSIQPEDEDVEWRKDVGYEVWSVERSEPWAGTWQVVPEGEGRACFSYILFSPFSIEVQQPSHRATLPVGKPIEIRAQVVQKIKQSQVAVTARIFKVSVTKPDGPPEEQISLEERDGVYVGRFDDTDRMGEYKLTFNATLQDGTKVYEITKVELVLEPWLECVAPAQGSTYESNVPIPLEARVYLAGGVSPIDVKVKATLLRDGEIVEGASMSCQETGESNMLTCDEGQFQAGHDPGVYMVNMTLESTLPPGIPVRDHSTVNIVILPPTATPTPTPSPTETLTPTPSPVPPTSTATPTPSLPPTVALTPAPSLVTPTLMPTPTDMLTATIPAASPTVIPTATPTGGLGPPICILSTSWCLFAIIIVALFGLILLLRRQLLERRIKEMEQQQLALMVLTEATKFLFDELGRRLDFWRKEKGEEATPESIEVVSQQDKAVMELDDLKCQINMQQLLLKKEHIETLMYITQQENRELNAFKRRLANTLTPDVEKARIEAALPGLEEKLDQDSNELEALLEEMCRESS